MDLKHGISAVIFVNGLNIPFVCHVPHFYFTSPKQDFTCCSHSHSRNFAERKIEKMNNYYIFGNGAEKHPIFIIRSCLQTTSEVHQRKTGADELLCNFEVRVYIYNTVTESISWLIPSLRNIYCSGANSICQQLVGVRAYVITTCGINIYPS